MRIETGVTAADGDWPGIFIRGDNAIAYSMQLRAVLRRIEGDKATPLPSQVRSLMSLLESCHHGLKPKVQRIELVDTESGG